MLSFQLAAILRFSNNKGDPHKMSGWWRRIIATYAAERALNYPALRTRVYHSWQLALTGGSILTEQNDGPGRPIFWPFFVPRSCVTDEWAIRTTTGSAGNHRAAIYTSRESQTSTRRFAGSPYKLYRDLGVFVANSAAIYTFSDEFVLEAGWYWMAVASESSVLVLQALNPVGGTRPIPLWGIFDGAGGSTVRVSFTPNVADTQFPWATFPQEQFPEPDADVDFQTGWPILWLHPTIDLVNS